LVLILVVAARLGDVSTRNTLISQIFTGLRGVPISACLGCISTWWIVLALALGSLGTTLPAGPFAYAFVVTTTHLHQD
jgi:hypothetical protein